MAVRFSIAMIVFYSYLDEIDASSTRQLAMLRFKRNEGIFEEILSPYAIGISTLISAFNTFVY